MADDAAPKNESYSGVADAPKSTPANKGKPAPPPKAAKEPAKEAVADPPTEEATKPTPPAKLDTSSSDPQPPIDSNEDRQISPRRKRQQKKQLATVQDMQKQADQVQKKQARRVSTLLAPSMDGEEFEFPEDRERAVLIEKSRRLRGLFDHQVKMQQRMLRGLNALAHDDKDNAWRQASIEVDFIQQNKVN
jgi:hypothetical protein